MRTPIARPYYSDSQTTLYSGDSLQVLQQLKDGYVQCVVTSPPYWGLRNYGTGRWVGGDPECPHSFGQETRGGLTEKQRSNTGSFADEKIRGCPVCGARWVDPGLGLEGTPDDYVERLTLILREAKRVLRDDGTLWLNLGDSYAGTGKSGGGSQGERWSRIGAASDEGKGTWKPPPIGLKIKDLCGIPWRVAFSLQADGWWLRSDIIWEKTNPMPSSVKDRPTVSHEYIFLLSKSSRYYFDQDALKEKAVTAGGCRHLRADRTQEEARFGPSNRSRTGKPTGEFRHPRTVWTFPTYSYKGTHFATFPPELPRRCILAGSPKEGIILDPFAGSGTTLMVARQLGRRAVGVELNAEYCALAVRRILDG